MLESARFNFQIICRENFKYEVSAPSTTENGGGGGGQLCSNLLDLEEPKVNITQQDILSWQILQLKLNLKCLEEIIDRYGRFRC